MTLQELFRDLSHGELSNVALSVDGAGMITFDQQPKIVGFTNQALKAIFTRFNLLERELVIDAVEHITSYALRPGQEYIQDTASDPFTGDVIRITAVYDELGVELPLNEPDKVLSLYTPSHNVLQIPTPEAGHSYFVVYQASHPVLVPGDLDQEISLPIPLEAPLRAHIAASVFRPMRGQEHQATADREMLRYEQLCQDIEQKGLVNRDPAPANSKFKARGWV